MNTAQSNQVRGQTTRAHACAPVPTVGVSPQLFVLPIEVKTDPHHADIKALLDSFTVATIATIDRSQDAVLVQKCTFDETTWHVGVKIVV